MSNADECSNSGNAPTPAGEEKPALTLVNLYDKIVDRRFGGSAFQTEVWLSEKAKEGLYDFVKSSKGEQYIKKLEYWAKAGFRLFEGANEPVPHKWDGVYAVQHVSSLFRLIGFYADDQKRQFIGMDAFIKRKTRLSSSESGRIDAVAKVRRDRTWKRRGYDYQDQ